MAHTKANGKKVKGVTVPVSPRKREKKAGNKRGVSTTTVQDLNVVIDKEVAALGQDKVSQKLEVMMKMLTDLSS